MPQRFTRRFSGRFRHEQQILWYNIHTMWADPTCQRQGKAAVKNNPQLLKSGIHNDSDGCDSLYNPVLRRTDYNISCCSAVSLWYAARFCDVTCKWTRAHASHTPRHTKGTCVCFARWNPSQINGGSEARRQLLNIYAQFLFYSLKQISNLGVSHGRAFLWFCSTTCGWCRALRRQLFFFSLCHNHLDPTFWAAARVPGIASSFSSSLPQSSRHR